MVFSTQVRHRCCICYRCPTNNFLVQDCIIDYDWYEWRLITMMLVSCTYMYSINTIIIMTSSNMVDECMSVWEYENVWEIERDRTNNYISYQIIRLQGRKGPPSITSKLFQALRSLLIPTALYFYGVSTEKAGTTFTTIGQICPRSTPKQWSQRRGSKRA